MTAPRADVAAAEAMRAVAARVAARLITQGPPARTLAWQESASCAGIGAGRDADPWFPEVGESREMRRVCVACPVIEECLTWALTAPEPHGIWGGTTPGQRQQMRAQIRAHR